MGIADKGKYLSIGACQLSCAHHTNSAHSSPELEVRHPGLDHPRPHPLQYVSCQSWVAFLTKCVVLVLVGCVSTSPGIPSLYLFLLKVNEITLRVGYFGISSTW